MTIIGWYFKKQENDLDIYSSMLIDNISLL